MSKFPINGIVIKMPAAGAESDSLAKRLMNDATKYAGRCLYVLSKREAVKNCIQVNSNKTDTHNTDTRLTRIIFSPFNFLFIHVH